ncbi:uncharacterized protein LOC143040321 isoform X2 [Oratosquilla oratoria]|uniref:uncharacterized protein LOC143040321 isoform X2 n=1 Tax=Oratosquilla oratoria TaxID=337810 RepID=UPI003F766851
MVHQEETMGQVGLCATDPQSADSLLPLVSSSANGTASEVHASLASLASQASSLNQEDLVAKLRGLINENQELKETIAQNNLALRQQLRLVVRWSQQCEHQQQQQRQQLTQLNHQITKLQQENALLSMQGGDKSTSGASGIDETVTTLTKRLEACEMHLLDVQENNDKLLAQRTRLEGDITLLKCDLSTARGDQERLQLERFELLSSVNELRTQLRQARQGVQNVVRSAEASPVNESPLVPDMEDMKKLKEKLKVEQDTSGTLLQELQDTRNQVENLEMELQRAQEETALYRHRCLDMQKRENQMQMAQAEANAPGGLKELDEAEKKRLREEAAMLREEVSTLETALSTERQHAADERRNLAHAHNELSRAKKELLAAHESNDRITQNDQYYQAKMKALSEQYDEATAKLVSYEELLSSKNEELAKLKKDLGQTKAQLLELHSESDTIAILKAQVEVYKGDFQAEREARESLASDREKLRDEVRHLQARNMQLIDELEAYQRRQLTHGSTGGGSRASSEEPAGSTAAVGAGSMAAPDSFWDRLSNTSDKKISSKEHSIVSSDPKTRLLGNICLNNRPRQRFEDNTLTAVLDKRDCTPLL